MINDRGSSSWDKIIKKADPSLRRACRAPPKEKAGPSLRAPTARSAQDDNVWLVLTKKGERGYGGEIGWWNQCSAKSVQVGLRASINSSLRARTHPLICFSRVMASRMSPNCSK